MYRLPCDAQLDGGSAGATHGASARPDREGLDGAAWQRGRAKDQPDYKPPFLVGATRADAVGNLWIRTTKITNGRAVYDVVNRNGALVDRVQLPPFRTIVGFGPGVVCMAVKDSAGVVHLERARVR